MSSRFDYVPWDEKSQQEHTNCRGAVENLELAIDRLVNGRAKSIALTKLEEVYMWIGKAVRDDQVARQPMGKADGT